MSTLEPGDRRRLLFAGVTTIAVLPFLLGNQGGGAATGVAAIGQGADLAGALDASITPAAAAPAVADLVESASPGFLIGPAPATDPTLVEIVVPTSPPTNVFEGVASYQRFGTEGFTSGQHCAFAGPAVGTWLNVLDLDNGKSVSCMVIGAPQVSARADIVLGSTVFAQIDDLGQAPVHVRITW